MTLTGYLVHKSGLQVPLEGGTVRAIEINILVEMEARHLAPVHDTFHQLLEHLYCVKTSIYH